MGYGFLDGDPPLARPAESGAEKGRRHHRGGEHDDDRGGDTDDIPVQLASLRDLERSCGPLGPPADPARQGLKAKAAREHRLDHRREIHRAAGGRAGAHGRVDFVDEEDRPRARGQRADHGLEALLEVAAKARAGQLELIVMPEHDGTLLGQLQHPACPVQHGRGRGRRAVGHQAWIGRDTDLAADPALIALTAFACLVESKCPREKQLPYLTARTEQVIELPVEMTHVRVSALDVSGNESPLSEETIAAPLPGTPRNLNHGGRRYLLARSRQQMGEVAHPGRVAGLTNGETMETRQSALLDARQLEALTNRLGDEVVRRTSGGGDDGNSHLRAIARIARESIAAMSDIVWAINPERDSVIDLVRKMRDQAEEATDPAGIVLTFNAPGNVAALPLDMDVRRDLFLIFKEVVGNAVEHAQCQRLSVTLAVSGRHLCLQIEDDGIGFHPAHAPDGNGLINIARRADRLGAALTVQSSPGAGTLIRVDVELRSKRRARALPQQVGRQDA